jgi:hypothetical protein
MFVPPPSPQNLIVDIACEQGLRAVSLSFSDLNNTRIIIIVMVVFSQINKLPTHGFVLSPNGEETLLCSWRTSELEKQLCGAYVVKAPN